MRIKKHAAACHKLGAVDCEGGKVMQLTGIGSVALWVLDHSLKVVITWFLYKLCHSAGVFYYDHPKSGHHCIS